MITDGPVLTPSQMWNTMEVTYKVSSSSATSVRFDLVGGNHSATWNLPLNGGTPVGTGDSALVELHPDSPLTSFVNGDEITVNLTFRIEPGWDDSEILQASARLVLASGVLSIPATHTWGFTGLQGYENDLEIKSVVFRHF